METAKTWSTKSRRLHSHWPESEPSTSGIPSHGNASMSVLRAAPESEEASKIHARILTEGPMKERCERCGCTPHSPRHRCSLCGKLVCKTNCWSASAKTCNHCAPENMAKQVASLDVSRPTPTEHKTFDGKPIYMRSACKGLVGRSASRCSSCGKPVRWA